MSAVVTDREMHRQVTEALADHADDFDVEGIVAALIRWYGRVDVGSIPSGPFWSTVYAHRARGHRVAHRGCVVSALLPLQLVALLGVAVVTGVVLVTLLKR